MTALLEFQRTLARAVMQPMSARDNMKRGGRRSRKSNQDGVALVKPNSRLSSLERLEIYQPLVLVSRAGCVQRGFSGSARAAWAQGSSTGCGAAIWPIARPSHSPCATWARIWWRGWSGILRWRGANYGIALEMAKLEWAHIESFDAAEHERLSPADIAALAPESGLRLQPHLRLIVVEHEVDRLLLEVRESAKRHGGVPRTLTRKRIARAKSADRPDVFGKSTVSCDPSL